MLLILVVLLLSLLTLPSHCLIAVHICNVAKLWFTWLVFGDIIRDFHNLVYVVVLLLVDTNPNTNTNNLKKKSESEDKFYETNVSKGGMCV